MLKGFYSWMFTMDHKRMGMIYMVLGIWGGFVGLSLSMLMRLKLSEPYYNLMSTEVYKYVITNHGIAMMFFFLMPVLMGGFGNYLLPLLLGLLDLNLPRLNALSAWLLLPSALCLSLSMVKGAGVGWTFYPPLSSAQQAGMGADYLMFSLHLAGLSSLLGSMNFISTIHSMMQGSFTLRMSIILWGYLFTSVLLLMSLPVLAAGMTMLLFDRKFGSAFFDPMGGGDPVLFQHLFWFFGHPEVYVLVLPGFGFVSHICMSLSKKDSLFGYYGLVAAMGSIVALGSVVWAHHMFMVGLDLKTSMFFSSITMIIGIPTGMKVFSWLYMLSSSNNSMGDPMLWWIVGFIVLFTMGGVTGIALSSSVMDVFFHDTWFVVAHFHYVLSLGSYSTVVMAFMWWWPIMTGCTLNKVLLYGHWLLSMVGFNLCFFPMHFLGIAGLPRRVCSYDSVFYWVKVISSLGGMMSIVSGIVFFYILWESLAVKKLVIGIWGSSSDVFSSVIMPTPHHSSYMSKVVYWSK